MSAINNNATEYRVFHKGQLIGSYHLFVDAWLHAKLECQYWTRIIGPEGVWIINPFSPELVGAAMSHMVMLGQFLTATQLRLAQKLFPNREAIRDQIILPNLAEINTKLGQENDPDYLSYLVEYAIQIRNQQS